MTGVAIVKGATIGAVTASSGTGGDNLMSPSPREVWQSAISTNHVLYLDLGSAAAFDTIYLGGCYVPVGTTWTVHIVEAIGGVVTTLATGNVLLPRASAAPYQSVLTLGVAATSRYVRIDINTPTAVQIQLGIALVGLAFVHDKAFGGGRPLNDLSRITELQDGGFGIDEGAIKAGYRWRFIDLTPGELEQLWQLLASVGRKKPVVVVEDVSAGAITEPAVHYGVFDKFEPWERANAQDTIWALSLSEWR